MSSLSILFATVLGVLILAEATTVHVAMCDYNGSNCPVYRVIFSNGTRTNLTTKYELRHYEQASWVATNATVRDYTGNVSRLLYYRLRNYIEGSNTRQEVMEMTVPVLTERGNPDANGLTTYTKHLFLTNPNAPEPSNGDVYKYKRPAFRVYASTYEGRPNYRKKEFELAKLKNSLPNTSLYNLDKAYFAGYNPPWVIIGRRNEVWVEAITTV